ncbi:MAG: 30S ribosomal protein S6--L-glutamate ligase [Bdellovibrionales bacterium]|nr:30S ribosomal protein S6--L-glutamate ligase [Bdellovibrionales bacterium]
MSDQNLNIALLSRNGKLYSHQRIIEEAESRGHKVRVIDYLRCYMNITSKDPKVMYQTEILNNFDAIIPRIGATHTFYGASVVRQFEMMGTFTVNGSLAISRSRDKLRCLQILARKGVGLPVTGFAHSTKDVDGLINMVGGAPLVVKLLEGTQGIGVVLAENRKAAESVIEAFRGLDANILVQEFVKEAGGADIRCMVIGGKVVASMMRKGQDGEFRSNLHRGGTAEKVKITAKEKNAAIQAAKEMGLNIAGVDLLRSKRGPVIMEVNSSPGLEGIEKATGVNVASKIVEYIEHNFITGKKKTKRKEA